MAARASFADSLTPACTGAEVDPSLRGSYNFLDRGPTQITATEAVHSDGSRETAWTCTLKGVLLYILVQDATKTYLTSAVRTSGGYFLNYGEVQDDGKVHSWDRRITVTLSPIGLDTLMRANKVVATRKLRVTSLSLER